MGAQVFANSREVSAKKNDNQSIAAMPDICLSPPSPPTGPVPIPYPNFSNAKDTSEGTRTVKIAGDEVGMKNVSNYSKSNGDEAATRALGMGVMTATIQGKTYHMAWSFDVQYEGNNAIRFMDMTTHNHMSPPMNTGAMTMDVATMQPALAGDADCVELEKALQKAESEDTKSGKVDPGQVMATGKHSAQGNFKAASQSLMKKNMKPEAAAGYCPRPDRPKNPQTGKTQEPNVACTDSSYNNWTCNSGHAEGKMIQKIFAGASPGGSVTLRIKWNDAAEQRIRQDPCPACKSAMCKTANECGLTFSLCEGKGTEEEPLKKSPAPCKDGSWKSPAAPPAEFA
jgi:hypothetical protein